MSSARAPFRRRLTAAQSGLDPLTHYWFKAGKDDYRRLCDDAPWARGLRYERPPGIECLLCRAMRHDDRLRGRQVFFLTYALQGIFAPSLGDVVYVPSDGLSSHDLNGGDALMRQVSMPMFARFYVAGSKGREGIVSRFKKGEGFNYYGPLTALLRRHLESGDIEGLRSARPNLRSEYRSRASDCENAKLDCIDLWTSRRASYFEVPPVGVPLGLLTVNAAPEVGMRTADGERVLKLWYSPDPMAPTLAEVYHYLLAKGGENLAWAGWEPGIWDVRRQAIPIPPTLPDDIDHTVADAAADLIRLLDSV